MGKYLGRVAYARLVEALADHRFDPIDSANAIKIALGEIADVWPESIKCPAS